MCKLLGIGEYGTLQDDYHEDETADTRLHDALQGVDPAFCEKLLRQLIAEGSGLGQAGHTVEVKTAPEVVGLTGNGPGTFRSKTSDVQN